MVIVENERPPLVILGLIYIYFFGLLDFWILFGNVLSFIHFKFWLLSLKVTILCGGLNYMLNVQNHELNNITNNSKNLKNFDLSGTT